MEEGIAGGVGPGDDTIEPTATGIATLEQLREEFSRLCKKQTAAWRAKRLATMDTGKEASQDGSRGTFGIPATASTMPGSWISAPSGQE